MELFINDFFSKCKQTLKNYMEIFFCSAMVYSEPCQRSKMECFTKIVNGFERLKVQTMKNEILGVILNVLSSDFHYCKIFSGISFWHFNPHL